MVVDLGPATGAVATLARILWGVAGSSPASTTCKRHALCARVELLVQNRLSVLVLPFCLHFSCKENVYKLSVRRDWYTPTWRSGIIYCRQIVGQLLESSSSRSAVS